MEGPWAPGCLIQGPGEHHLIGPWTLLFLLFLLLVDRQVTLADRLNRRNSKNSKAGEGPEQVPMHPSLQRLPQTKASIDRPGITSKYSNFLAQTAPKSELL